MGNIETLVEAVKAKKSLRCYYAGVERVFSPHAVGKKGDHHLVLVYQFGGESWSSDKIHITNAKNWRVFDVSEIKELKPVEPDTWHTHRKSYTGRPPAGWTEFIVAVKPQ